MFRLSRGSKPLQGKEKCAEPKALPEALSGDTGGSTGAGDGCVGCAWRVVCVWGCVWLSRWVCDWYPLGGRGCVTYPQRPAPCDPPAIAPDPSPHI